MAPVSAEDDQDLSCERTAFLVEQIHYTESLIGLVCVMILNVFTYFRALSGYAHSYVSNIAMLSELQRHYAHYQSECCPEEKS